MKRSGREGGKKGRGHHGQRLKQNKTKQNNTNLHPNRFALTNK